MVQTLKQNKNVFPTQSTEVVTKRLEICRARSSLTCFINIWCCYFIATCYKNTHHTAQ
jgi:hypothetical protein